jgi:hypothetical protein
MVILMVEMAEMESLLILMEHTDLSEAGVEVEEYKEEVIHITLLLLARAIPADLGMVQAVEDQPPDQQIQPQEQLILVEVVEVAGQAHLMVQQEVQVL